MSRDTCRGTSNLVELLGVEGDTERGLDSRSESLGVTENEDTGVVDLTKNKNGSVCSEKDLRK